MNCKDVQEILLNYFDPMTDAESRLEIKQHLEGCEQCRLDMQQYGELFEAIDRAPMEKPGQELRENFQNLLQSELNLQTTAGLLKETEAAGREAAGREAVGKETPGKRRLLIPASSPVWRVAAALILLLGGIGIGTRIGSGRQPHIATHDPSSSEILALQKEVKEMKEVLMVSMLDDESASQRLKAVSYVEDMPNPDQRVIDALVSTLNHDKNVNVRLASLYSLARFADLPAVRDSLVNSLNGQTEPIIQVVLINILTDKKETRAIGPIRNILSKEKTLKEVREIAEKGLKKI